MWLRFLLFIILIGGLLGATIHQTEIDTNTPQLDNVTSRIKWNASSTQSQEVVKELESKTTNTSTILTNIIHKTIDYVGFVTFEITRWSIHKGYEHPGFNFLGMIYLLMFIMAVPVLIPLAIIIYLGFILIIGLIKKIRGKQDETRNKV